MSFLSLTPAANTPSLSDQGRAVQVLLVDCNGSPVAGYPGEDIWIEDSGEGTFWHCVGGTTATGTTDSEGVIWIDRSIAGGGSTTAGTQVLIAGVPIRAPALPLDLVSPDLDGDLVVALPDFARFGLDFGSSEPRSDLVPDGTVDLGDFARFGLHYGEGCP